MGGPVGRPADVETVNDIDRLSRLFHFRSDQICLVAHLQHASDDMLATGVGGEQMKLRKQGRSLMTNQLSWVS